MAKNTKIVEPDTTRVIEGFRDTGYTFEAAIADIIDNAIGPGGADTISVTASMSPSGEVVVRVADDGCGMDMDGIENAMRYGAERQANANSLSKFGLGLKTASTQFCRRLVVVSRKEGTAQAVAAAWDLDSVAAANAWVLEHDHADLAEEDALDSALEDLSAWSESDVTTHGTLVTWEKVDRLLKTKGGKEAKNQPTALKRTVTALREHLRMVFQRYLNPADGRARTVSIILNEEKLTHWDPFAEKSAGEMVKIQKFRFQAEDGTEHVALLRAFILPRKDEFADLEEWKEVRPSLDRQGIYLYREGRLIDGPGWLGTGAAETHVNNLRVELSFDAQLDHVFGVGIKKSGVHLDPNLVDVLIDLLGPLRREADKRSRAGRAKTATGGGSGQPRPTDTTIARVKPTLNIPKVTTGEGSSVVLVNKTGEVPLVAGDGTSSGIVNVNYDDEFAEMNVVRRESLQDGVLWDMSLSKNNILQVELNAGHDWFQKAYLPIASNSTMVQAIEFLFYALAQAELDATNAEVREVFEDLRVDVSRNLRKLVKDLPEPRRDDEA